MAIAGVGRAAGYFAGDAAGKRPALIAVICLHVGFIALLVTGTAHRVVNAVTAPVKVALLDPPKQPPPPEPAPLPEPPPVEPPRPVFVPPPEVRIVRPKPVQVAVQTTPIPPPPAPVARPVPAPPAAPKPPVVAAVSPKPAKDLSRPAKLLVAQCEQPGYPASARREEATGTSRIRFEVDAAGRVVHAEVVQRSGRSRAHRLLDRAAVDALSQCEFTPGRDKLGRPTGGHASVDYVWRLE